MAESMKVTGDRPGFAPVPLRIVVDKRIDDPTTIAVYVALGSFMNWQSFDCHPSYSTIGEMARVSADTAKRHIDKLISLGYVEKTESGKGEGKSNHYHVVNPYGSEGYRTDAVGGDAPVRQGGTAPVPNELYPINESKERKVSEEAAIIISDLNEKSGKAFRPNNQATQRLIKARLREGFTVEDFKAVHAYKSGEWKDDPRMCEYLRPSTLYSPSKFESYLQQAKNKPKVESLNRVSIDRQTGQFSGITDNMLDDWAAAFPDVDVALATTQVSAWILANPGRKIDNVETFILSRGSNRE